MNQTSRPRTYPSAKGALTVPEAAYLLGISRTSAYKLANRYLATNGAEGLPAIRLGRTIRCPRSRVLAMLEAPAFKEAS